MNLVDLLVIVWMLLWGALGLARGATEQVLSLVGLVGGALAGSRLAWLLLPEGRESVWLPAVALGTALILAALAQALLLRLASPLRRWVSDGPLRGVDHGAGALVGAASGLLLAWLVAVALIYQPVGSIDRLRAEVRGSAIMGATLRSLPPADVLGLLARIDPFPVLPIPPAALPDPDPSVLASPGSRRAAGSVVLVQGQACGLLVQGSGWAAAPDLIATNAHVIAGQDDPRVLTEDGRRLDAEPVHVDAQDDIALLRVEGLDLAPLIVGDAPGTSESVVLLGHPGGGSLRAEAATATRPRVVLANDAYGRGPVARRVIVTRGTLGPGSSGGPVVDSQGRVVAMIFGGSQEDDSGAAVPPAEIRDALDGPLAPVGSGPCTG